MNTSTIPQALEALHMGKPVLVLDDTDRENEGDVILAGQTLRDEWLGWTIRHTSGYLCAPMPGEWADRLGLPLMVAQNQDSLCTAYTVSVDASQGVSTGISAGDRAHTVRVLADPESVAADLIRPGHILPLRARAGGVLARRGHTEACVDLCRLAGLAPVGVIGELVRDDGEMMRAPEVAALGATERLPVITIKDLVAHLADIRVVRAADTVLPTARGDFLVVGYADERTSAEHLAIISPRGLGSGPVPVRIHSECLTGDVFGSLRCDCGPQLEQALDVVAHDGGVVVYLRGHEGRGVGLLAKLQAYHLQDDGFDTVDAQLELGLPVDDREYGAAAAILRDLGITSIRLLTNNPAKTQALGDAGVSVVRVEPLPIAPNPRNEFYLRTKRDRMGHTILQEV